MVENAHPDAAILALEAEYFGFNDKIDAVAVSVKADSLIDALSAAQQSAWLSLRDTPAATPVGIAAKLRVARDRVPALEVVPADPLGQAEEMMLAALADAERLA